MALNRRRGIKGCLMIALLMAMVLAPRASAAFPSFSYSFSFGSGGSGEGKFGIPSGMATDAKGNLWVADMGNGLVQVFDSSGKFLSQFSAGKFPLVQPVDIAFEASGNAWVVDAGAHRVVKFNSEGKFLSEFGGLGSGNGQLNVPSGIALDSKGNIWISDSANKRIQEFNSEGKYIRQAGKEGTGEGQFSWPQGVTVAADNSVWVVDGPAKEGGRIEHFTSEGSYVGQIASGVLKGPSGAGLAMDAAEDIWVADTENNVVRIFSKTGTQITQFGGFKEGEGSLLRPRGIELDANGNPWVAAEASSSIQKWLATPEATNLGASEIGSEAAALNALVNARGSNTTYQFEYGTTVSYGTKIPVSPKSIGSESKSKSVSETVGGLTPEITYHYRVVASNVAGVVASEDKTFTTTEKTGTWLLGKGKLTEALLPSLKMIPEGKSVTLLSSVLKFPFEIVCTGMQLIGGKLELLGKISSATKIEFSGCQDKFKGEPLEECSPHTSGAAKGQIVSNQLKGQLDYHEGHTTEPFIRFRPSSGSTFMTLEMGTLCPLGNKMPMGGTWDFKGETLGTLAAEQLFVEGPLKSLWLISDTAEHKVTMDGSAILSLTGEHAGVQWSGTP